MKYLFDTNAVIYFLKGTGSFPNFRLDDGFYISCITKIELLGNTKAIFEQEKMSSFLDIVEVIYLNEQVTNIAINIQKSTNLKLPDAAIVATAKALDAQFLTADIEIIKKTKDITVINPLTLN